MKSTGGAWMSSKDAAVKLNVHVRTLRNWIDTFSPYMVLQKNSQGHFLLSEQAFHLLIEIKRVKDSGIQTLKEVEDLLLYEKVLPERKNIIEEETHLDEPQPPHFSREIIQSLSHLESVLNQRIFDAFSEISATFENSLPAKVPSPTEELIQKEMLKKIEEIEKKQETLKLELRKINFEIQLMNALQKENKKKGLLRFFRWPFFRKNKILSDPIT